jgi:hypothetical protein
MFPDTFVAGAAHQDFRPINSGPGMIGQFAPLASPATVRLHYGSDRQFYSGVTK